MAQGIDYRVDYYNVLEIPRHALPEQIESAYNIKVEEAHESVTGRIKVLQKKLAWLSEAHDVLSDNKKRAAYDKYAFGLKEKLCELIGAANRLTRKIQVEKTMRQSLPTNAGKEIETMRRFIDEMPQELMPRFKALIDRADRMVRKLQKTIVQTEREIAGKARKKRMRRSFRR